MGGEERQIETPAGTVILGEDGVVYVNLAAAARLDLPDLEVVMAAHIEIVEGRAYPALVDLRSVRGMTRRAIQGPADHAIQHIISRCALLPSSAVTTVFARFFVKIVTPSYPVKVYRDRQRAIEWLREDPGVAGGDSGNKPR